MADGSGGKSSGSNASLLHKKQEFGKVQTRNLRSSVKDQGKVLTTKGGKKLVTKKVKIGHHMLKQRKHQETKFDFDGVSNVSINFKRSSRID